MSFVIITLGLLMRLYVNDGEILSAFLIVFAKNEMCVKKKLVLKIKLSKSSSSLIKLMFTIRKIAIDTIAIEKQTIAL